MRRIVAPFALLLVLPVYAQESASFKLTEHVFNAGGNPADGAVLASASFRIKLDAIGESVAARSMASNSFHMGGGFVSPYLPPREVQQLEFIDKQTLAWDQGPDRAGDYYNLYRDSLTDLVPDYGTCQWGDTVEKSFNVDSLEAPDPPAGEAYFYLVTADYRLEESTKGFDSDGHGRPNDDPCP